MFSYNAVVLKTVVSDC